MKQIGLKANQRMQEVELEEYIIVKAVKDYNTSKFSHDMLHSINGIIADVFLGSVPLLRAEGSNYSNLTELVFAAFKHHRLDYNKKMNAVDRSDQLLHYAEFRRRTVKWWKRAFFHLFILAEVNTYQFYKQTEVQKGKSPMTHSKFRRELCKDLTSLVPMPTLSPRQKNACIGDTDVLRLTARHFPSPLATKMKDGKQITVRRQCFVCSSIKQRKDVCFECSSCKKALCVSPCFQIYHTNVDYKRARERAL